jgi:predicted PurR-regulated permease PerM
MRRGAAIALVYLALLLLPALLALLIVPPIATQLTNLVNDLPAYAQDLQDFANRNPTLRRLEENYQVTQRLQEEAEQLPNRIGDAAGLLQDAGLTLVNSIFALVTILVLSAFMLGSGRTWVDRAIALQPEERALRLRRVVDRSARAVGAYVGGALLQATIAGVLAYIVLTILGVPFRAPLAVLIFFLDLIPLVGATIGAVVVAMVTVFVDFPTATIVWVIWSIVYQQVENNLIQPRIQQRALNVHPLIVLISVLFGSTMLGIVGALLAIPVAATIQIVIREWWGWRADQQLQAEPGTASRIADREEVSTGDDPEAEPPTPPPGSVPGTVPPA